MTLDEHPFQILNISSRSNRREILEQAEALSSATDNERLTAARLQVTHPAKRIEAEVSWFPGIAPVRTRQIIERIQHDPSFPVAIERDYVGLESLAAFNALVYYLIAQDDIRDEFWESALSQLSKLSDLLEPEEIGQTINADRSVAGFPRVDSGIIQDALRARVSVAAVFLAGRPAGFSRARASLSSLIARETDEGESHASDFLTRLIDQYQILVQPTLNQHAAEIDKSCDQLLSLAQQNVNGHLSPLIGQIEGRLADWDRLAQPIQLLMKSRGLKDEHSIDVGRLLRSAAIRLANEFDMHDEAQRITARLSEAFEEVPQIAELTEEDSENLSEIIRAKQARRDREEASRKEIELDMMIGRKRLQINHEFIAYRGRRLQLEDVSRVRWGIFRQYTNGICTSRCFTIWVGSDDRSHEIKIECVRFLESDESALERYATVLSKIWRAVGFRLLLEMSSNLMEGQTVAVGEAAVTRNGICLPKRKWFGSEPHFAAWEELGQSTHDGELRISSRAEKKASISLSLREVDNAVILERLLDVLWKDGNYAKLRSGTLFQDESGKSDDEDDYEYDEEEI